MKKLLSLVLALGAVAALGVATASQAAAEGKFTTTEYPAIPTGIQAEKTSFTVTLGAQKVVCPKMTMVGATIAAAAESVNVSFVHQECTAAGNAPTTITATGCTFVFAVTSTSGTTSTQNFSIACPSGKQIEVDLYATVKKLEENVTFCRYGIAAQGPIAGTEGHNVGEHLLQTISAPLSVKVISGFEPTCGGKPGSTVSGSEVGTATIWAQSTTKGTTLPMMVG